MMSKPDAKITAPEQQLVKMWHKYGGSTLGRFLFNLIFGFMVPYSGTIRPQISEIKPGFARVVLKDRRIVRNHLRSIHAIALANLGEIASGLAMIAALPQNTRAIVTHIDIEYTKKARGTLTATGSASPPQTVTEPTTQVATASIVDRQGDIVATLNVHWLLGPRE